MNTHYETAAASVHYGTQQQCMQLTKHHVSEHKLHNTAAVSTRYRTQPPRTYITTHSSSECTLQKASNTVALDADRETSNAASVNTRYMFDASVIDASVRFLLEPLKLSYM